MVKILHSKENKIIFGYLNIMDIFLNHTENILSKYFWIFGDILQMFKFKVTFLNTKWFVILDHIDN